MKTFSDIRQLAFIFTISLFSIVLINCTGGGTQGRGLMSSSGRSGELLVVCTNSQWKGVLGDSLQAIFMRSLEFLPQNEPLFNLSHIDNEGFTPIYQKQRNILHLNIGSEFTTASVKVIKNKWASPQLIVYIEVADEEEAMRLLSERKNTITDFYLNSEIKRFQRAQKSQIDNSIHKKIERNYSLSMVVPQGFIVAVQNDEFCWLRKETKYWGQSVLMYVQNYSDTNMFLHSHIVSLRNQMTKKYVFGSVDSSYMIVEEKYIPPQSEKVNFNDLYAVKTQGIWKMHGDFMGGPFITYTILDAKRKRVVTLDGFLYAPTDDKRDLLRQIDAILLSTRLIE
ncbi:MAG: DUF4837 family protein [Bacteroidales bacterium]|jgi:hypothetical protein|nr:DUF4837 family protein [Bacteroidales bacterium]